jgi:hypothetical protein
MITFPIGSYFLSVNTIFGGLSLPAMHASVCPMAKHIKHHLSFDYPYPLSALHMAFHSQTHPNTIPL